VYQENKNKILNELAKFDNKIELFRKNGASIKQEMQKLHQQVSQKKNFIEEYFVTLIERLDDEYKEKKEKVEAKYDENVQEIEFLESFRDNICQELECKTEKELINKSEEFITYIKNLCEREVEGEEESYSFDTM
jgi:dsDNA-specific endonuclease/ATPase MutS2